MMNRLLGIFFASAVNKLTDESRDNIIKEAEKVKTTIYDILDPIKTLRKTPEDEKEADTNRGNYMQTLASVKGDKGFATLEELVSAITALDKTITEFNGDK